MPEFFATHFAFLTTPEGWAAMVTLIAMEVVLGIDNLIFISILTNKLPPEHRERARRLGISAALIMRLVLLATIAWIVGMTAPVFSAFGHAFSWRDLILIAGGLFLVWKATKEIHHTVDPGRPQGRHGRAPRSRHPRRRDLPDPAARPGLLGRLDHHRGRHDRPPPDHVHRGHRRDHGDAGRGDPLANFIEKNPTIVMLALGFLLMIGTTLIADGFGFHVPKGYIYAAMAFSALVEGLNMLARRRRHPEAPATGGVADAPQVQH